MSTFKNFVQCRVTTPITAAANSIGLYAVVPPYTLPSEEGGLLVLTDSPSKPSKLEVISYTSRSALGLYGVTRGLEGTTALEWIGPVYCYQSLLAGEFKTLLDSKAGTVHIHTTAQVTGLGEVLDNKVDTSNIAQTTGQSTTNLMSQTAITSAIANIPSVPKSAAYTVTSADKGKSIDTTTNVTIPASVFVVGDIIVVTNTSATNSSITAAAGVTIRLAGTASSGTRTLAGYGVATFRMVSSNIWFASGAGLS